MPFNTSKVRFRADKQDAVSPPRVTFNTSKVRFRAPRWHWTGQREHLSIPQRCDSESSTYVEYPAVCVLSIPQRCDSESAVGARPRRSRRFQYLKGAIQSDLVLEEVGVRKFFQYLKGAIQSVTFVMSVGPYNDFQYLKGAIQSFIGSGI